MIGVVLEEKSISEMTLEEILSEIRELEQELPRPFVQVVVKTIRSKGKHYRYAYLQWREGRSVRSVYLGREVPWDVAERIRLQNRLKSLKRELRRRIAGVRA